MRPNEFWWTEDQQVTVTNPTSEDFLFKVHSKDYVLGAGKSARMLGYIAWAYVWHMSVKRVQEDGKFNRWNEEGFRKEYFEKFVIGVDDSVQAIEVAPQPEVHTFEEVKASKPELNAELTDEEEGELPQTPEEDKTTKAEKPKAKVAASGQPAKV